jgi:pimeloyl-ACP methyl ester carboxylesterase
MFYLFPSEMTVRTEPSGGDFSPTVDCGTTAGPRGHNRVILLIHGYANSVDAARTSYTKFMDNLQSQYNRTKALAADVFRFFWPGDEQFPGISQLSYPFQIENAYKSGRMLADFLNNLPPTSTGVIELFLVTHSLGGRVAMELLRYLHGLKAQLNQRIILRGLLMMAAAVQETRLDVGGDLNDVIRMVNNRHILYSPSDTVLHYAFPLGQTATSNIFPGDHEGLFPQAVGRFGNPRGVWSLCQGMYKYEHGDYWPRATTSEPVAQFFGIATENRIPASQTPVNPGAKVNVLHSSSMLSKFLRH